MANPSKDFQIFVESQLEQAVPEFSSKSMFGGVGYYSEGFIFALLGDGELYCKVDAELKKEYEAKLDSHPFVYGQGNHPKTTMNYYRVPDEILQNIEELTTWAGKSINVSKKTKNK